MVHGQELGVAFIWKVPHLGVFEMLLTCRSSCVYLCVCVRVHGYVCARVWIGVPQRPMYLKALFPACGATGRWRSLYKVEPHGKFSGLGGMLLKGIVGPLPSGLYFCFLAAMRWEASSALCFASWCHMALKQWGQLIMDWNLLPVNQSSFLKVDYCRYLFW